MLVFLRTENINKIREVLILQSRKSRQIAIFQAGVVVFLGGIDIAR